MNDRLRPSIFMLRRVGTQFALYGSYFLAFLLFFAALPVIAQASTVQPMVTHKIEFNDTETDPYRTLDWRSPGTVLTFDIPDNDWVDDVELLLSARPASPVNPTAPLLVRFNDAAPIPIEAGGNGFDAQVVLERMKVRKERNQVSFEYQVPAGAACLMPEHGAWDIHAAASTLVVTSRPKSRDMTFADVRERLAASATAPKTVTLLAKGPERLKLQALAAQGLVKNVADIPNFRTKRGKSDLEILIAPRSNLSDWVTDKDILEQGGPSIALGGVNPLQIVLTGDTDYEVMEAAKIFSNFAIPTSRSRDVTPMRFISTAPTLQDTKRLKGTTKFSELGHITFKRDWAPRPKKIIFDIADPAASFGRVSLKFQSGPFVASSSMFIATLNGHTLGQVNIDKRKMTANFDIPRGVLHGLNNQLTLIPKLNPVIENSVCATTRIGPSFSVGSKSYIKIKSDFASDLTDLSRFAASGLPFAKSNAKDSHVVLSTQSEVEYNAALKLLAKLARASKNGWSEATFHDGMVGTDVVSTWPETSDILVIGSQIDLEVGPLADAPKGLKVAMGGSYKHESGVTQTATNLRGSHTLLSSSAIVEGGVASLFRDADQPERLIGVITQTRGQSFTRAVENLLSGDHWNALEGSVARWNEDKVTLAQTSMATPTTTSAFAFNTPSLPNIKLPDISLPDLSGAKETLSDGWAGFTLWVGGLFQREDTLPALQSPFVDQPQSKTAGIGVYSPTQTPLRPATLPDVSFSPPVTEDITQQDTKREWRVKLPNFSNPFERQDKDKEQIDLVPQDTLKTVPLRPSFEPTAFDTKLGSIGTEVSTVYNSASAKVTDVMQKTPLSQYRNSARYESKYLLFALFGIALLLGAVFVSPTTKEEDHA